MRSRTLGGTGRALELRDEGLAAKGVADQVDLAAPGQQRRALTFEGLQSLGHHLGSDVLAEVGSGT